MSDDELQQSLARVQDAMGVLSRQFHSRLEALEAMGVDAGEIKRLAEGARAMKDSSSIYLEWAQFYAKEVIKAGGRDGGEADEDLLDEGAEGFEGFGIQ
jgi:hypothetical protein